METINSYNPTERLNPLNDFIFFKVMGEKGNEVQLLGFLNAVLANSGREPILSVDIQENQSFVKDIINGKSCVLDVLAVLADGTKVNIEIQLSNKGNMELRSLFYWSKIYFGSLKEGHDFRELPNVICINIIDYNFLPDDKVHTCFKLRETENQSLILTDVLEIHFINMVKWRKQVYKDIVNNPLHRWLSWFDENSPPELVAEVVGMDNAINAANERQTYISQDEEARRTYWSRRMAEHDLISGLNHARREGREERELEVAKNLKANGVSIDIIAQSTGLTAEEIVNL